MELTKLPISVPLSGDSRNIYKIKRILFLWGIPKMVYNLRNVVLMGIWLGPLKMHKIMGNTKCGNVNLGFAVFEKPC